MPPIRRRGRGSPVRMRQCASRRLCGDATLDGGPDHTPGRRDRGSEPGPALGRRRTPTAAVAPAPGRR